MKSFKHITPSSRVFYGPDSLKNLYGELSRINCSRALILCDPYLAQNGTFLDMVRSEVSDRCVGVFTNIVPNSPVPAVMEGVEEIKRLKADALIVIGGGSTVTTARAINIIAAENADLSTICTKRDENGRMISPKLMAPKLPIIVVPTTPSTAFVKSGMAIFDPSTNKLIQMFDPKVRFHSLYIHPYFIQSVPEGLLLNASLSSLACAVDGLLSNSGNPMSDALLIHALRLLATSLSDPTHLDNPDVRGEMMLGATLCGMGSDYTGFGISIVLGHATKAHFPISDGFVNAIVLPHTIPFNGEVAKEGIQKIAKALGVVPSENESIQEKVSNELEAIISRLNIPHRLRDMKVPHESFTEIAETAMDDWYLQFVRRPVGVQDLVQIMEHAW